MGAGAGVSQSHRCPFLPSGNWEARLLQEPGLTRLCLAGVSKGAHAGDLSCVVFRKLLPISLPLSLLSVHFPAWTHPTNE